MGKKAKSAANIDYTYHYNIAFSLHYFLAAVLKLINIAEPGVMRIAHIYYYIACR